MQPPPSWTKDGIIVLASHYETNYWLRDTSFIGANDFSLATVDWYTRFITSGGKLMSGNPNGKDFRPHVDSATVRGIDPRTEEALGAQAPTARD